VFRLFLTVSLHSQSTQPHRLHSRNIADQMLGQMGGCKKLKMQVIQFQFEGVSFENL